MIPLDMTEVDDRDVVIEQEAVLDQGGVDIPPRQDQPEVLINPRTQGRPRGRPRGRGRGPVTGGQQIAPREGTRRSERLRERNT
jgi:hypothetical protein